MHNHTSKNGSCAPHHRHAHDHQHTHCHAASQTTQDVDSVTTAANGTAQQHTSVKTNTHASWRVLGMDCPSCASKIKTAVRRIAQVTHVDVIFASEKLKVSSHGDVTASVEAAVAAAGFKLAPPTAETEQQPSFWRRTRLLLAVALLTAISSLLNLFSSQWSAAAFIITTLIGLYSPARAAWRSVQQRSPFVIETLMTVAGLGALMIGAHAEAAMVILLFLLGEQLEAYAAGRARRGVMALMALKPERALRRQGELRESIPLEMLQPGDIIEVAAGGRVPADGRLLDDFANFDQSAITGESLPVEYQRDALIAAGSTSLDRLVSLTVTSRPGESAIDRILTLIEEASSHRDPVERLIDRFSRVYTPAIMLIALLVMILPPLLSAADWYSWIYKGLALMLIGCPCALVIATPAAITSGLASAAKQGALIKGGAALEQLSRLTLLAFDKTGTLTLGQPQVRQVVDFAQYGEAQIIALAAAVEQGSTHPLAQAIVDHANQQQIVIPEAKGQQVLPGLGIRAEVGGHTTTLCSPAKSTQLTTPQQQTLRAMEAAGQTLMVLAQDDSVLGAIAVRDQLRPEARSALAKLRALGIKGVMLTGDNPHAAAAIANELDITFQAGLLPEDKVNAVHQMKQHAVVGMVGDGINDAPAMRSATIGIAMGGGTDVALESADVALTRNDLNALPQMLSRARATRRIMMQNISIAIGLKVLFLVTTLLGVTGLWMAVLADSGATALVTLNALRLLRSNG